LTELTDESGDTEDPAWLPDGKTLAFAKFDASGKAEGIYTIQVDSSNLTQVSNFGAAPAWSPNGKQIAFINKKDGIYLLSIATGTQIQIANGISAKSLAWSPNGLQIAFSAYTDSEGISGSLGLMNTDGSNRRQFNGIFFPPAWSPDGTKIAYKCSYILCAMNADGSGQTQLSHNILIDFISASEGFSWSPDGQYIVYGYSTICPGCGVPSSQLWIMKADGSQQTKLTDGPYDRNPIWRPAP
jgi:Tol biopolymer transport system component